TWVAPASGFVSFDTSGSEVDTVLGIYTGAGVGQLVGVAANNDAALGGTHSRIEFEATAGVTYRIAVEGADAARDPFVLRWRQLIDGDRSTDPVLVGGNSAVLPAT